MTEAVIDSGTPIKTPEIMLPTRPERTLNDTWVIAGVGMLTPAGRTAETWQALHEQRPTATAIKNPLDGSIDYYEQQEYRGEMMYPWKVRIAGHLPGEHHYTRYIKDGKELRRGRPPATQYAMETGGMALEDSGLYVIKDTGTITERDRVYGKEITRHYRTGAIDETKIKAHQIGVVCGTTIGSGVGIGAMQDILREKGPDKVPPLAGVELIPDTSASAVEMALGINGSFEAIGAACASSASAIITAVEKLERHKYLTEGLRAMLAVGTEDPVIPVIMAAFTNITALTRKHNDTPEKASSPFDIDRSGFVMGTGAGAVLVTSARYALENGLPIYGTIAGMGEKKDVNVERSLSNPDGTGINTAMRMALEEAGLKGTDVEYVNAHATSTPQGDGTEAEEIRNVCGPDVWISSGKGVTNHLLGASGVVEAVQSVLSMKDGESAPPNTNLVNPEVDAKYVMYSGQVKSPKVVMSNSAAFGGQSVSLVFTKFNKGNLTEI